MSRAWARLRYFALDAVDEWRHSPGVNILACGTLVAALFLAGLVLMLLGNLDGHLERWRQDVRVDVYLHDDLSPDGVAELQETLEAGRGVERVAYIDKQQALVRFRNWFSNMEGVPEELGENPLPASFEVFLKPSVVDASQAAEELMESWSGLHGVEEVRFDRQWLDRLDSLLGLARVGGTLLAVLVFSAVGFVIASVLRLAVYARRDEIDIMLLVGATPGFVRGPFLVAGFVQGLVGSGLSVLLVEGTRRAVLAYTGSNSGVLLSLAAVSPLSWATVSVLMMCGVLVSLVGSYFAVRNSFNGATSS